MHVVRPTNLIEGVHSIIFMRQHFHKAWDQSNVSTKIQGVFLYWFTPKKVKYWKRWLTKNRQFFLCYFFQELMCLLSTIVVQYIATAILISLLLPSITNHIFLSYLLYSSWFYGPLIYLKDQDYLNGAGQWPPRIPNLFLEKKFIRSS